MDIYDRILEQINANNMNPSQLAKAVGLSTAIMTQWKQRKQKPSIDKLQKIAYYFQIPIEYFLISDEDSNLKYYSSPAKRAKNKKKI